LIFPLKLGKNCKISHIFDNHRHQRHNYELITAGFDAGLENEKCQIISKEQDHVDYLITVRPPFPFTNREILRRMEFIDDFEGKPIVLNYYIERSDCPFNKKHVRGFVSMTSFTLLTLFLANAFFCEERDGKLLLVELVYADPKGHIPIWVINMKMKERLRQAKSNRKAYNTVAKELNL
jgi:hypothetical protein